MDNTTTFEEIDAHINSANLTDYQPGGKMAFTATRDAALLQAMCLLKYTAFTKWCALYSVG